MKTLLVLLATFCLTSSLLAQTLTKEERKAAVKFINWTTKELKKSIKGLSDAQLNYKSAPEKWSPQECAYHVAFAEGALRGTLDQALKAAPDPKAKAEIKTTDEMIKTSIMDRTNKVKTFEPFEPKNISYKSLAEAMADFDSKRAQLIALIKTSTVDMRNQIVTLPFAKMDAYQFILFIAGHTNRHTQQINEVKTASGYPQS